VILVVCNDTYGGVLPYARLAEALRDAGHPVHSVGPEEATDVFTSRGLTVTPLPGTAEAARIAASGLAEQGTLATLRIMRERLPVAIAGWLTATRDAAVGARLIIGGIGGSGIGRSVGQAMGVPFLPVHLHPIGAPSWDYPSPMLGRLPRWLGPLARRISHPIGEALLDMPNRGALRQARASVLGLRGPLPPEGPAIYALSLHLVPVPNAPGRIVTGIWRDAVDPPLPPTVADFLAAAQRDGVPVVSAGFGSMGSADPAALSEIVTTAIRAVGARGILIGKTSGLNGTGADILSLPGIAHGSLFPKVNAIIHHGGAGTTGAASLSGVPQVIVPFAVDQPFWGASVAARSAGPQPIPRRALTTDRLTHALSDALTNPTLRTGAAALGRAARAEPGLPAAVTAISDRYRGCNGGPPVRRCRFA
jgi:sterol 3beta-glucosyltransferase